TWHPVGRCIAGACRARRCGPRRPWSGILRCRSPGRPSPVLFLAACGSSCLLTLHCPSSTLAHSLRVADAPQGWRVVHYWTVLFWTDIEFYTCVLNCANGQN